MRLFGRFLAPRESKIVVQAQLQLFLLSGTSIPHTQWSGVVVNRIRRSSVDSRGRVRIAIHYSLK